VEKKELILGRNPVMEYLRTLAPGAGGLLRVSDHAHGRIIDEIMGVAKKKNVPVRRENREFFSSLGPSSAHQGVALEVSRQAKKHDELSLLEDAMAAKGVLVALDQITDPHNAGAIIRSAEALGCHGIIMPAAHTTEITPVVIKASAGATAYIPVITVSNLASFLEKAKKTGFWIIGSTDHGDRDLDSLKNTRPAIVVIGSEGSGMRRLTEEKCDYTVRIPLRGRVSSLNASVAAGIILYEILKETPEKNNH
jgi:23S rRNA (guanosine2251-2'-O)-methyltransferase